MSIRTNGGFHWIMRFWKVMESSWDNFSLTKTQFRQKNKWRHVTTSLREDTTLIFENLHANNYHPDKTRGSFKLISFTSSSELRNETFWRGCEDYSQVNNLSCLWNQGCLQNVQELFFFFLSFIKVDFKIKFMSCLKNQSWYKNGAKTPIFWIFVMVHVFG